MLFSIKFYAGVEVVFSFFCGHGQKEVSKTQSFFWAFRDVEVFSPHSSSKSQQIPNPPIKLYKQIKDFSKIK